MIFKNPHRKEMILIATRTYIQLQCR